MRTLLLLLAIACSTPVISAQQWVDSLMSRMTVEQKIGQLLMMHAYSNKGENENAIREGYISKYHLGGVIFMQGNPESQVRLVNRFQQAADIPLLVSIDGEWGLGMRLKKTISYPRQMELGAIRDPRILYDMGFQIGKEMRRVGVNINFAPDVDVNTNPKNPVIGTRSFGENEKRVARSAEFYMKGLQDAGVMAVAKHFPGHGNTSVDSHFELPKVGDSREELEKHIYPFRHLNEKGVKGMMVGHLYVPSLDTKRGPSSTSRKITHDWLRDSIGFQGLIFTDGLGMNAAQSGTDQLYIDAIMAGNDILLFPADVKKAYAQLTAGASDGRLPIEVINDRCRRILQTKYEMGLSKSYQPLKVAGVLKAVNSPEGKAINELLVRKSITLLKNDNGVLPLRGKERKVTVLHIGTHNMEMFDQTSRFYQPINVIKSPTAPSPQTIANIIASTTAEETIVVTISTNSKTPTKVLPQATLNALYELSSKRSVVLCLMLRQPYALSRVALLHHNIDALLMAYSTGEVRQKYIAQALFGGIKVDGRIPITALKEYPEGTGVINSKTNLGITLPEIRGVSSKKFYKVDSIINGAINGGVTPGCVVLAARGGDVVFHKRYGQFTYSTQSKSVDKNTMYDVASITKVIATNASVIKLVGEGKLSLDERIGDIVGYLKGTDKGNITIRDLLYHQSGLPAYIPFMKAMIDEGKLGSSPLFANKRLNSNYVKISSRVYGNGKREYYPGLFSSTKSNAYPYPVAKAMYASESVRDSIQNIIVRTPLEPKRYRYSDIGFMLLHDVIDQRAEGGFEAYVGQLWDDINLHYTSFNPFKTRDVKSIPPTEEDKFYRRQKVQGYVNDSNAAILGGVSGHAGAFSSAGDLARIMQLFLNKGMINGHEILDAQTVSTFTLKQSPLSRRSLGFDKPELKSSRGESPVSELCSPSSFGHTGFTGTIAWADPRNAMVYVFISNRTYPSASNRKLIKQNTRTKIQSIFYESIIESAPFMYSPDSFQEQRISQLASKDVISYSSPSEDTYSLVLNPSQ